MTYVKKLVMYGFKSFARKTEMPFSTEINVVIGPNGSGKSNIADALCFVLGRLSAKSMRAAKTSNLIFSGNPSFGPAKEAIVEIVFDNSNKTFSLEEKEISIKRILRKNGQSIYRINGKTKTRQDILTLLAEGGIDPNGFNIILQNEIQNFATGTTEERRKIIEEVAGISIYEIRKEKSLKELEKTSLKLKEVEAILRERTTFLNNLEKEKEAAEKKKFLEEDFDRYKKSLIYFDLLTKRKEKEIVEKQIEEKQKEIENYKKNILTYETNIQSIEEKIIELNQEIQKQTGLEQEHINKEISDLRAEIAVLKVKIESSEKKLKDNERQSNNFEKIIKENIFEIEKIQKESPTLELIKKELEKKKKELEELSLERKKHYTTRAELKNIKERLEDKKKILQNYINENDFLIKQINSLTIELYDKKTKPERIDELKISLAQKKELLEKLNLRERQLDKQINVDEFEIKKEEEVIEKIQKIDVCPLCKSKITSDHIHSIKEEIKPKIISLEKEINLGEKELTDISKKKEILREEIDSLSVEIQKRQSDLMKIKTIIEKEEQIKILHDRIESSKIELVDLEKKKNVLEDHFDENSNIEERYETLQMEVQNISIRNKENLDSEIQYKQNELERAQISINQIKREAIDLEDNLLLINQELIKKEEELNLKRKREEELRKKADKFIQERNEEHKKQRELDLKLSSEKNKLHTTENFINNFNIDIARVDAQIQGLEIDILEYPDLEIVKKPKEELFAKLKKVEETLSRIGNVNMRALEVYSQVREEYDSIKEKVETISREKEKILSLIHKIDIEKKKIFIQTIEDLNVKFDKNFSQISSKGQVYLEIQNKKDPFLEGIDVILKTGHGKYFDIKSLSGGEQTMVALSLIFAIQELKPYSFYIFDEIDAALDKRNASRLADFLNKYAKKGQYIIISHNDEIISNSTTLFGISMHEGISKLVGLKI